MLNAPVESVERSSGDLLCLCLRVVMGVGQRRADAHSDVVVVVVVVSALAASILQEGLLSSRRSRKRYL